MASLSAKRKAQRKLRPSYAPGHPLRLSNAGEEPGVHRRCRAVSRVGHRGERYDLQLRSCASATAFPVQESRRAGRDRRIASEARMAHELRVLSEFPELAGR